MSRGVRSREVGEYGSGGLLEMGSGGVGDERLGEQGSGGV